MAKILVLAKSGFGKTTSWAGREKLGIKGLNPKETYVIQCIGRGISNPSYKLCPSNEIKDMAKGNRVQVILECTEQKNSGVPGMSRYITTKNRKNTTERLELKKYNPYLKRVTVHKEIK